jgi:hypothetical protein
VLALPDCGLPLMQAVVNMSAESLCRCCCTSWSQQPIVCLTSGVLRPLAFRLTSQAIEKRMRQATAAAEAARSRADAANSSLADLWGAAMATYEAAGCTAAEVRTLQTPSSTDVHP